MLVFNDIGFDQLPKFDVPARFLPTKPIGIESTVPAQIIGTNSNPAPTTSANNTLLYVFIGGIVIFAGCMIIRELVISKPQKQKN